tara:strand:- start:796 stop:984 length:189 start_codon:yes stop_codon:yes gene_type:complete
VNVHVTVGVDVDGSGNLTPFVKSVSQEVASEAVSRQSKVDEKQLPGRVAGVIKNPKYARWMR